MSSINAVREALENPGYEVGVSNEITDPSWDAFLAAAGGEYPQTSMWAQVKSESSYQTWRVIARQGSKIVGGSQLLVRSLPIGAVGYMPLGPVLSCENSSLTRILVQQIRQLAKRERIRFLAVQAPWGSRTALAHLREGGFSEPSPELVPTASVLIDLSSDLRLIFSQMSATTRKHLRRGEHNGIAVREGTCSDLLAFYSLACETADRHGFAAPHRDYFSTVWRAFAPGGHIKMFVVEIAGEPLSALLVIAFGNIVTCWRMGWSGKQPALYPNEAMHWAAIQWAKSQGYRYFDFGGISRELAKWVLAGGTTRVTQAYKANYFKLGFGGQPRLLAEPLVYIHNPLLRRAWPLLSVSMARFRRLRRLILNRFASGP